MSSRGELTIFCRESSLNEAESNTMIGGAHEHSARTPSIEHIRLAIEELLESGHCNIDTIASLLNVKKRTAQRYLKQQKQSFTLLVDEERKKRATHLLLNSSLDLKYIAISVGYSEHSAFSRSFKNWYGKTPSQWRKWHREN